MWLLGNLFYIIVKMSLFKDGKLIIISYSNFWFLELIWVLNNYWVLIS